MSYPTQSQIKKLIFIFLSILLLASCRVDETPATSNPPTLPGPVWLDVSPEVTNINPGDLATDSSIGGNIIVTFNTKLDPTSVTDSTFSVSGVTGSISVADNVVSFRPTSPALLAPNTQYLVTLSGGEPRGQAEPRKGAIPVCGAP